MKYTLPRLYKRVLLLAIVFGPIFWLMFTADGQRRTDIVMLWLFGAHEIKLDLEALAADYREQDIRKVYAALPWACEDRTTAYGDRLCTTRIGIFNGIPARYLTTFFQADRLSALKLRYRLPHHRQLQARLHDQLGEPVEVEATPEQPAAPATVLEWRTPRGLVVIKAALADDEEAALFWLSDAWLQIETK